MTAPYAEIRFELLGEERLRTFERFWYHVPAVGDFVSLKADDVAKRDEEEMVIARVEQVIWLEDGHVVIAIRR